MSRFEHMRTGMLAMLIAGLLLFCARPAAAESRTRPDYEVKADYLPVFAQFVKWPESAFSSGEAPLVIGALGSDKVCDALEASVKKTGTVGGRPIKLVRARKPEELKGCHVLFVSKAESAQAGQVLAAARSLAVLTVGDSEGFAASGGIVNFFMDGTKVRFEINHDVARSNGLAVSSQLLGLARIVQSKEKVK